MLIHKTDEENKINKNTGVKLPNKFSLLQIPLTLLIWHYHDVIILDLPLKY